jgi:D-glycero-D-manno-heptose 1,7-bisphosphate phosphatase
MGIGEIMKHKAVFLDRDGVLNHAVIRLGKPYPPATLEELSIPHDAKSALATLKSEGFLLIVVTNQPDVVRRKTSIEQIELINNTIKTTLNLDDVRVCYHDDVDNCKCRKPKPGLIVQAALDHDVDLSLSFMIGDRWRDIEAGHDAGVRTIWLYNEYNEKKSKYAPDFTAASLTEAAEWIMKN